MAFAVVCMVRVAEPPGPVIEDGVKPPLVMPPGNPDSLPTLRLTVQYLASYHVQRCRVVKRSGWHENLQHLLTRMTIQEELLSDLQECMEDFTSDHATALPQSALSLGKRELLH